MASCSTPTAARALLSHPQAPVCQPIAKCATGRCHRRLGSLVTISQQAEAGTMSAEVAALQEIWSQWRIPSQERKAVHRTDEWKTLSCRVVGTLGVLAPPSWRDQRTPGAHLVVLRCNSPQPQSVPDPGWQMKLPARCHICGSPSTPVHPTKADSGYCHGSVGGHLSPAAVALPHALPRQPCGHRHGRVIKWLRRRPIMIEGSDELSLRALSTTVACDMLGITELNAGIGGLRRSVELLERIPGVHAASEEDPACSKRRGPPQSGSRKSSPCGPSTLSNSFSPHLSLQCGWLEEPHRCIRSLTAARPAVPRARRTNSFIIWDGSQVWFAQQHRTRKLQSWPTATYS